VKSGRKRQGDGEFDRKHEGETSPMYSSRVGKGRKAELKGQAMQTRLNRGGESIRERCGALIGDLERTGEVKCQLCGLGTFPLVTKASQGLNTKKRKRYHYEGSEARDSGDSAGTASGVRVSRTLRHIKKQRGGSSLTRPAGP